MKIFRENIREDMSLYFSLFKSKQEKAQGISFMKKKYNNFDGNNLNVGPRMYNNFDGKPNMQLMGQQGQVMPMGMGQQYVMGPSIPMKTYNNFNELQGNNMQQRNKMNPNNIQPVQVNPNIQMNQNVNMQNQNLRNPHVVVNQSQNQNIPQRIVQLSDEEKEEYGEIIYELVSNKYPE